MTMKLLGFGAVILLHVVAGNENHNNNQCPSNDSNEPPLNQLYMKKMIAWDDYDATSPHVAESESLLNWSKTVSNSRKFRQTKSGQDVYSYRNKILMGMGQTRVLNHPPGTTLSREVVFDIPTNVPLPDTPDEILSLSVLELQSLLRQQQLTSVQLTQMALDQLVKYDAEFNVREVALTDLAMDMAAQADMKLAQGVFVSPIQGIPFAIKDTYDVKGYATAYGSWEFLEHVVQTQSPLVTKAIEALAVPLFKSSVPQMTFGTANFNGTVYSCLNGGYSAGPGFSGGSSSGSATAVCLGVVPVALCEQTGSSCESPALANGISTVIPALGTLSRENNGVVSPELDRPGLLCRDIMSCVVFYNEMRGATFGDPQSRDVPFADPSKEDVSTYTIGFSDSSDNVGFPPGFDTPFKGKRMNVLQKLKELGGSVVEKDRPDQFLQPSQLLNDYLESTSDNKEFWRFDSYWMNVEGIFESVFNYGGTGAKSIGPVWKGQNFNFEWTGWQAGHMGATAYAYLEDLWLSGYVAETAVYPMLQDLPDVVVHFSRSELGNNYKFGLIQRAGINTVHIPEFYWNTSSEEFVDWAGSKPSDHFSDTTISAAMITCESKKYEPVKAFAVCYQLQKSLVPGGKLVSPNIETIHKALKTGAHSLDCPYDWSEKDPQYLDAYPPYLKEKVLKKSGNQCSTITPAVLS